jgi:hypothetical protein
MPLNSLGPVTGASRTPSLITWILIVGGAGFAAGFFGPMIFSPDSNQGPMAGIFITGPGGALLGALLGLVFRLLRVSAERQRLGLWIAALTLVIVTCFSVMPGPQLRGDIVEIQIAACGRPAEMIDGAYAYWDRQLAPRPEAARPGWKDDSREMLQSDDGVTLAVDIVRSRTLNEERKFWNSGHILASEWQSMNSNETYYARYAGGSCSDYAVGTRAILYVDRYFYGIPADLGWPPKKVPHFLNLQTIDTVPDPYRIYTKD